MKSSTRHPVFHRVEWIDTGGGPFVLVPAAALPSWEGVRGVASPNDFDRACEVTDYLGTIPFATADALVLGDAPFPTAYLPAPAFGGGYIVRMLWGDDMVRATHCARRIPRTGWTTEAMLFDAGPGGLVLMDAAHGGGDPLSRIEVPLGPGCYALASADWEDDTMCLLVHRLVPLS